MKGIIIKAMCSLMSLLVLLGANIPGDKPSFFFFGEPDFPEE
ncbi:MAG: cyclic lactone autoinducer peptide [Lachnospiraceae bacterium]|nr:cyclic lactone autoinducer peptide [Lachnospiraceae bacterium]